MPGEDAYVQVISRLGVDFGPAISSAQMLANVTAQLDRQLKSLKLTVADLSSAINRDMSAQFSTMAGGKVIYDQYGRALTVVGIDTEQLAKKTKTATQVAGEHAKTVKDLNKEYSILGSQWERRISWFAAGLGFFGSLTAMQQMASTISDVELGMTRIRKVIDDVSADFGAMQNELLELGMRYGVLAQDVLNAATLWAQAGYKASEIAELTRTSLLAMNVAELTSEESVRLLIAALKQFNMTAEESQRVIDAANQVSNDYAVTAKDVLEAIAVSGQVAKNAGISMEELTGYVTALSEATGRSGKEIGNAIRSIIAFSQRPKAIEVFKEIGVDVVDAEGNFRKFSDVFLELSQKWTNVTEDQIEVFNELGKELGLVAEGIGNLTDVEKTEVAQAGANLFRRNYFISLMEHMTTALKAAETATNSLGSAERENALFMESYAKKVDQLKASLQALAVSIGEAGLLDQLKNLVEGGKGAVDWLNSLDQTTKRLILTFGELMVATKVIDVLLKMAGFKAVSAKLAETALNLAGFANLLKSAGTGLLRFFGGPVGLAVTTAATALLSLISHIRQTNKEMDQNTSRVVKLYQQYEQYAEKLSTATEGTNRYNQISGEMQKILNDIGAIMPELITDIDTQGNILAVNTEKIKGFKDAWEKLASTQKTVSQEIADIVKKRDEEISRIKQENETLNKLATLYQETREAAKKYSQGSEEAAKANKTLQDAEKGIINIIGERTWVEIKSSSDIGKAIEELIAIRNKHLKTVKENTLEEIRLIEQQKRKQIEAIDAQMQAMGIYLDYVRQGYSVMTQEMPLIIPPKEETVMGHVFGYTGEEAAKIIKPTLDFLKAQREYFTKEAEDARRKLTDLLTEETAPKGGGAGGTDDTKGKEVDILAEKIRALADAAEDYALAVQNQEAALAATNRQLTITNAEYDYLNEKMKTSVFTTDDYARMQVLVAQKISLLRQEQERLTEANAQYQNVIDTLRPVLDEAIRQYEHFKAVGDAEHMRQAQDAVSKLQQEIERLNDSIAQNTAKIWENKGAMESLTNAIYQAYYQNLTSWMRHMENIGRLTVEQQLEILKGIDLQRLALQDQWRVEEDIYRRRRQALQDEMDNIREAYDGRMRQIEKEIEAEEEATQAKIEEKEKRIEAIDEETNAQIKAIQALIDALDVEDEQSDREEAERQHNQKIADLQKQYQYHELRTGLEHQQSMADIQKQIAEEEHRWELQKQEWARQDQKKAYQQQIEALREQAKSRQDAIRQEINEIKKASDQKKKELQNYYDEIQRLLNSKTLDMLASLSMTDEQWYQRGLEWMRQLAAGIRDGQTELPSGVKELISEAEEAESQRPRETTPQPPVEPVATFTAGDYTIRNDRAYAQARLIGQKLGLPVDWDASRGLVTIGGKSFFPDFIENDRAYLSLRTVGTVLGYLVEWANNVVKFLPKAHIGAYVRGSGVAELLQGERVLSPRLTVSFDRLANVLANFPNIPDKISLMQQGYGNLDRLADRIIAAIEKRKGIHIERLFNAETVELADRMDMEIFSRELMRAANMLQTARG